MSDQVSDQYPRIRAEVSIGATTFTVDYTIDWCDDSGERWAEIIDQQIERRIQP